MKRSRRLPRLLLALMAFALIMGPGPGILLVNPDPADPQAIPLLAGMPVIWLWAIFWCLVQASSVLIAYFTVWKENPAA